MPKKESDAGSRISTESIYVSLSKQDAGISSMEVLPERHAGQLACPHATCIYIYIYMCVCVCVCQNLHCSVYVYHSRFCSVGQMCAYT